MFSKSKELQSWKAERKFGSADIKVLVVGTGNSGKSTILKQIKILMMGGFSVDELRLLRPNIYESMLNSMNMLTKAMKDCDIKYDDNNRVADAALSQGTTDDNNDRDPFTFQLATALTELWADKGIQQAFSEQGENIHLANCAKYLFDDMTRIRAVDYLPTAQDILECRTMTAGAVRMDFKYSGLQYSFTDMGGQRNVRKKWAKFYEEIEGIIFVVALSEYDQAMQEDESTNRIHDSMKAFSDLVNNPLLVDKPIVLLMNKNDLFEEKLHKIPLSVAFRDYKGGPNCEAARDYVLGEFMNQIHGQMKTVKRKGTVYPFFTHATSTREMKFNLEAVLNILKTKVFYSNRQDHWNSKIK